MGAEQENNSKGFNQSVLIKFRSSCLLDLVARDPNGIGQSHSKKTKIDWGGLGGLQLSSLASQQISKRLKYCDQTRVVDASLVVDTVSLVSHAPQDSPARNKVAGGRDGLMD